MPYTLSHAIIALPLATITRGKIPIASVIVGSMSPDFPYLLALTPTEAPGHSALGVFIYCLLPSLLLLMAWYRWLEAPTLQLFGLSQRAHTLKVASCFLIVTGVLLGAYSHVLWDASSHADGAFVENSVFWHIELLTIPLFKWNQYSSGIGGILLLVIWYLHALFKNQNERYQGRISLGVVTYFVSIFFFISLANIINDSSTLPEYAAHTSIGLIVGSFAGMCIYAFADIRMNQ